MEERKVKRAVRTKRNSAKKVVKQTTKNKTRSKKMKIKPIIIVDYVFLVALALSVIFGVQTNTAIFFIPFTITLIVTLICMSIILINAIYSKIKKKFRKVEK